MNAIMGISPVLAYRPAIVADGNPPSQELKRRLLTVLRNESYPGFDRWRAHSALEQQAGGITPSQDRILRHLFRWSDRDNGLDENRTFELILAFPNLTREQSQAILQISKDAYNKPMEPGFYDRRPDRKHHPPSREYTPPAIARTRT